MQISKDTLAVIKYLDEYSNGSLRKKNDVAALLEIGASNNASKLLNDLIFSAKSCWNLFNKIRKANSNIDGMELVEKEFNKSLYEMMNFIGNLMELADEETFDRFDKIYLAETQGAAKNLVDLSYDLSVLKNLQADMKTKN